MSKAADCHSTKQNFTKSMRRRVKRELRACCIRLTVRVGFVTGGKTRRRTGHTSKPSGLLWMVEVKWCIIFIWVGNTPSRTTGYLFVCFVISIVRLVAIVIALFSFPTAIDAICRRICCFLPILRILPFEGGNIERIPHWLAVLDRLKGRCRQFSLSILTTQYFLASLITRRTSSPSPVS